MPYEVFMLENGVLLFYGRKSNSSKFGKEDVKHRIQLDETLRLTDIKTSDIKVKTDKGQTIYKKFTRFNIVIKNKKSRLESLESDNWVDFLSNFDLDIAFEVQRVKAATFVEPQKNKL